MTPELLELARLRWLSDGSDEAFDRVWEITHEHHELVPALIRAMITTAPRGRLPFIGTSIIEDLFNDAQDRGQTDASVDLLLAAQLSTDHLFAILSGIYPEILLEMDAEHRLAGHLSAQQIAWLLNPDALGRREPL